MQDGAEALASTLKADLGDAASVTDQSGGWVLFELTGETLAPVLERLCNIDLTALSAGKAQRTVIEHIGCFVLCETPQQSYRLLCGRSYALSFVHAVETAMNSVDAVTAVMKQ
jgi:sarcosine oxidase subunit gamma